MAEENFESSPLPTVDQFNFVPRAESQERYEQRKALRRELRAPKILLAVLSFIALVAFVVVTIIPDEFVIPAWSMLLLSLLFGTLCFTLERYPVVSCGIGIVLFLAGWIAEIILVPGSLSHAVLPKLIAIAVLCYAAVAGVRYRRLSDNGA